MLLIKTKKLSQSIFKIAGPLEKLKKKGIFKEKAYLSHRLKNFIRSRTVKKFKKSIATLFTKIKTKKSPANTFNLEKLDIKPVDQIPDISIITWDCAHNAAGPAYWIADALTQKYACEVVSGLHKRFGDKIWTPVSSVPVITRYVKINDDQWDQAKNDYFVLGKTIQSDTIICSKYRPGSIYILLGALSVRPRKIIFYVDDIEQQFSHNNPKYLNDHIDAINNSMHILAQLTEANLSSPNKFILSKFKHLNQTLIAHTRPNYLLDVRTNKKLARINLGFFGTVRKHKSIQKLLMLLAENQNISVTIGGELDQEAKDIIEEHPLKERIKIHPIQKYDEMIKYLCNMDFVVCTSDISDEISQQTSGKISDAIGLGITPIISRTKGNEHFINDGVALDINLIDFKIISSIQKIEPEKLKEYFRQNICYSHTVEKISSIISSLEKTTINVSNWMPENSIIKNPEIKIIDNRFFYIHLWKQFDSGLWGRRIDGIAEAQYKSHRTKSTLVINKPVSKIQLKSKFSKKIFEKKIEQTILGGRHFQPLVEMYKNSDSIENLLEHIQQNHQSIRYVLYPYLDYIDPTSKIFKKYNTIVDVVDNQILFNQRDNHKTKIFQQYLILANRFTTLNNRSKELLSNLSINIDYIVQNSGPSVDFNDSKKNHPPEVWYPGNLDADRLDFDLLRKIDEQIPELKINFIGSVGAKEISQQEINNVVFHKPVLFEKLVRLIRIQDIIIIPHANNPLVNSMDPLKLYLGALNGLRVISTVNTPLFGTYNVAIHSEHDAFISELKSTLLDRDFVFKKPSINPLDSWESRTIKIDQLFSLYDVTNDS